jgi:hypothetical protein
MRDPNGFDWEYPPFVEYGVVGPLFPKGKPAA